MRLHRAIAIGALLVSTIVGTSNRLAAQTGRETPLVRAIKKARPSVINIHSQKVVGNASAPNRMSGMGTGVVVDERGYIVTNYHVIEDVSTIRASTVDGSTYVARVIARDPETDLALLKIDVKSPLPVMPMGSSEDLMHGETVVAIGNAFGYEHTVTSGIISELHRDVRLSPDQAYHNLIQTDASINPGNSGGPLINIDGEMIGLNVAIRAGAQGIGFAIPVDAVKRVLAKLLNVQQLTQSWHGMVVETVAAVDQAPGRIIVRQVEENSPAEKAGLQSGDRITAVANVRVDAIYDLERALLDKTPGESITFEFIRGGRENRSALSLASVAERKATNPLDTVFQKLGIRLAGNPNQHEVRKVSEHVAGGLKILDVAPNGYAAQSGIQPGDILVGLHQWETLKAENVIYILGQPEIVDKSQIRYYIVRAGQVHKGWLRLRNTTAE